MYVYVYIYIYIYVYVYNISPTALSGNSGAAGPTALVRAKHYTPEIAKKVRFRWKMLLKIQRTIPVKIRWKSDGPLRLLRRGGPDFQALMLSEKGELIYLDITECCTNIHANF